MLNGLRKAGQSWLGKAIFTVLFGILIVSFAIWGIGDIFRGAPQDTVARVGDTTISVEQLRTAYQNELQRISRQLRTNLTPDQARAFGLDRQVLSRLISEAVLNERARQLGLSASDELVVQTIRQDPSFQGMDGQFGRTAFDAFLRNANMTEAQYVREQRAAITRFHLADAIGAELPVPLAAREAVHRATAERRSAEYTILPSSAAGEIAPAAEDQLQAFYNDRKASFRAPEYRALNIVALNAQAIAKPGDVSDADARQRYEQVKNSRFGTPERRTIQQIVFPSMEEAEAAFNRVKEGATFESIAAERGIEQNDLTLGTFAKSEMLDPTVADAAFALAQGAVSGPVQGRFGTVLVRATDIQPAAVKPFEEVANEVKAAIAQERARTEIDNVHDAVEDLRASARPLAEIAREKGLNLITVPAVDRNGLDKAGQQVTTIPETNALLTAAFASDIGVDNEPLRASDGGYVWFDVTSIEPAREKTFEEVREEVARSWHEEEISRRLADKAKSLVERLDKGESLASLAGELGLESKTATELARGQAKDDLTVESVNRIFATPVGKGGSAAAADSRTVFKVTAATVPPLVTTTQEAERIESQLRIRLSDDLLAQYIARLQADLGVAVNEVALRQAVGGES